jgi:hypothetical protein
MPVYLQAIGASERVLQHLNDPPAPQIASGQVPPGGVFRGDIELRGVWYTYPNRCGAAGWITEWLPSLSRQAETVQTQGQHAEPG